MYSKELMEKAENNKYPFGTIFFTRQKVVLEGENTSPLIKCMVTTKDYNWYNAVCEEDVEGMDCNWGIHKSKNTSVTETELNDYFETSDYIPTKEDEEWANQTKQQYLKRWQELDEIFKK